MLKNKLFSNLLLSLTIMIFSLIFLKENSFGQTNNEPQESVEKWLGFENPKNIIVAGDFMQAYLSAYQAFMEQKEITPERKDIKNYLIKFSRESDYYEVKFLPKYAKGEVPRFGGATSLGKTASYKIDAKTFQVIERNINYK